MIESMSLLVSSALHPSLFHHNLTDLVCGTFGSGEKLCHLLVSTFVFVKLCNLKKLRQSAGVIHLTADSLSFFETETLLNIWLTL